MLRSVQTMGKLKEINKYVRLTLDKLQGKRAHLVRMDNEVAGVEIPTISCVLRKLDLEESNNIERN